jgi:hypothetical protein
MFKFHGNVIILYFISTSFGKIFCFPTMLVRYISKVSTKMSSSDKFLHETIAFCKHKDLAPARNPPFTWPTESDLYNWIEAQSKVILQTVIPNMCWESHLNAQPRTIVSFSQKPSNPQECVLMLMLWSFWGHECHQDIMKCLEYGSMELKSHRLEWVCLLTFCIVTNLQYSAFSLPLVTKLRFRGNLFVDSKCMRQVVPYSAGLHQLFDHFFSVRKIMMLFGKELLSCKLLPIVSQKPSEVASDNNFIASVWTDLLGKVISLRVNFETNNSCSVIQMINNRSLQCHVYLIGL